jgi:cytidine deaminase
LGAKVEKPLAGTERAVPEAAPPPPPATEKDYLPEIVIGFVAPTGIRAPDVKNVVKAKLKAYGYESVDIHISKRLEGLCGLTGDESPEARIELLQTAGNEIRKASGTGAALAHLAILGITGDREFWRKKNRKAKNEPRPQCAYLVWSLKRPDEVGLFRSIYGSRFILLSLYAPRTKRVERLATQMADKSHGAKKPKDCEVQAEQVIIRDELEEGERLGQEVRKAYPLADYFVDASDDACLGISVERSIDIIFGAPFETPTIDEFGMAVANVSSLRSAELGRQVGAAIVSDRGEIVTTGTNEVPLFGGGHFWPSPMEPRNARADNREFAVNDYDTSDREKGRLADQVWDALNPDRRDEAEQETTSSASAKSPSKEDIKLSLRRTGLPDLTEFGRAVHGEMSALMDAARRGVSVVGMTMYVTTFPCHQCTRHIIAAGIKRLVYIYPYPKSRAHEFHRDSISLEIPAPDKVDYSSFLGVAPRTYPFVFEMGSEDRRKSSDTGKRVEVHDLARVPRLLEGAQKGRWDTLAYLLIGEKKANEETNRWQDGVLAEVSALMKAKPDTSPKTTSEPLSEQIEEKEERA